MKIRPYEEKGRPTMTAIWNEVVAAGVAFPQTEPLTLRKPAPSSLPRPALP